MMPLDRKHLPLFTARVAAVVIALTASLVGSSHAIADERLVWFGTYTGGPGKSEGIYVAKFNDATGTLSPAKLAGTEKNPSFLAEDSPANGTFATVVRSVSRMWAQARR